jgi:hypothetical protein
VDKKDYPLEEAILRLFGKAPGTLHLLTENGPRIPWEWENK